MESLNPYNINSIKDIFEFETFIISMSNNMKNDCIIIKNFLNQNVYNHPKLNKKRKEVENIINQVRMRYLCI